MVLGLSKVHVKVDNFYLSRDGQNTDIFSEANMKQLRGVLQALPFKSGAVKLALGLIGLAALSRFLPHYPNMTAIGAISLFSAYSFRQNKVLALLLPVVALLLTDLVLGFHATMIYVYGSTMATSLLALWFFKGDRQQSAFGTTTQSAALASVHSLLFFIVTNFGVWISSGWYPKTTEGLAQVYVMGLPFLFNQVLGDLLYTVSMFAAYFFLLSRRFFKVVS